MYSQCTVVMYSCTVAVYSEHYSALHCSVQCTVAMYSCTVAVVVQLVQCLKYFTNFPIGLKMLLSESYSHEADLVRFQSCYKIDLGANLFKYQTNID